jgi:hypothetical protein
MVMVRRDEQKLKVPSAITSREVGRTRLVRFEFPSTPPSEIQCYNLTYHLPTYIIG